jgi:1,4-dihydroxy-2-naphthoate octaprenyltransferase
VGSIIARLVGVAWSIASVFVIPVIVRDESTVNPLAMLQKSAGTLKKTWGEGLIGYIGIGAVNTLVMFGSLIVLGLAGFISAKLHNFWLLGSILVAWFISMIVWSYLMNVAGLVYKGALYLYAAEGIVQEPYDQEMLDSAWKFKR